MNLIKINLNQTVSKAEKDFISQEKKRWYTFYIICGLFTISFIWLISINSRLSYIAKERNNTIENIITDTNNLKSTGKINLSKKDINNLYKLESKRIFWTEKLIALSFCGSLKLFNIVSVLGNMSESSKMSISAFVCKPSMNEVLNHGKIKISASKIVSL